MIRSGFPLALLLLIASALSRAQNSCPEGFRYAGTLSGTGSSLEGFNARKTFTLPENATLDESFQQKNVRVTNGKSGVHSSMLPKDVPKGLLLLPHGTNDPTYEPGWAVSDPELKALSRDANGNVTRYQFGMKLVCSAHPSGGRRVVECSVGVDVCYKPSP